MRVTYSGPHTDGVLTEWGLVLPGKSIDVPDGVDLGGDFAAVKKSKADPAASKESN